MVGGILSVISGKNFLSYYSKKHEFTDNVINIEDEIDKIEDLKGFLQERLGSDWEKIKLSLEAYQAGELDKNALIRTAIKNIGDKFIEIFKPNKRGELNEV